MALVRSTNAFSIGPDLTNSNADAFHSGMGEVVAIPVVDVSDSLRVGYLTLQDRDQSEIIESFLDYLGEEIALLTQGKTT